MFRATLLVASLALAAGAPGQENRDDARRPFVRNVERDDGGEVQVLVATYRKGDATLTLHAALHVADVEHYAELQRRFAAFDALLYELIADEDDRPHPGMVHDAAEDWFTMVQDGLGRGLGLASQTEQVDYRKANFVHADMTNEEFTSALKAARSSLLRELAVGDTGEPDPARKERRLVDLVAAYRDGRGLHALRLAGACLVTSPDASDEPTVLIEGRNEKCLAVLQQQLAAGKKNLGIYYGAAHMEHLERRLLRDLGWQRTGEQWIVAWDNRASRFPVAEKGLQQKRYRARTDVDELTAALQAWQAEHQGTVPTWELLRAARADGKLPGRANGVDPWGRDYLLRAAKKGHEVRCLGSDGVADTDDDLAGARVRGNGKLATDDDEPGFFGRMFDHLRKQREYRARLDAAQREWARSSEANGDAASRTKGLSQSAAENENLDRRLKDLESEMKKLQAKASESLAEVAHANAVQHAEALRDAALAFARETGRTPTLAEALARIDATKVPAKWDGRDPWGHLLRVGDDEKGAVVVKSDGPDGKPDTGDDIVRRGTRD